MKRHRLPWTIAATFAATVVLTGSTGQTWAAPSQPGTVKPAEKPAQQPGTDRNDKKPTPASTPAPVLEEVKPASPPQPAPQDVTAPAPVPPQQEVKPAPVEQPVPQDITAPAAAPAPQESADNSGSISGVTPVRPQGSAPEVESVREKNSTLTTGEFRNAVHASEEEHRDNENTSPAVKITRTDEDDSTENLSEPDEDDEDDEDKDDSPHVPAPTPAVAEQPSEGTPPSNAVAPAVEASHFSGGASVTGAHADAEITADTTAATGLIHSEINVGASDGASMTVDTNPTTSLVQGDLSIAGQALAGEVQVTAVESQLYEVAANGGSPLAVDIPTEITTAVEQVTEQAQQLEVPVEVTTAAEQATAALNDVSHQVSDAIPSATAMEATLPAGAIAHAWYQVTN